MTVGIDDEIARLEKEVEAAKHRLVEARRKRPLEEVAEYGFTDWEGNQVKLSALFGDKEDLVVIHNMGTGCSHCTMWADGFTGLVPHLSDRCSLVVVSPDPPDVQKRFAGKRNWNFRMLSAKGNSFNLDMGFEKDGDPWPGISTFKRNPDGKIFRVAKAFFDVGDDFCATWPILDLLDQGSKGWQPKYFY